jgi:hypothetical protein
VDLPELLSRTQLRAAGYSDVELRRLLLAGELVAVRPGSYLRGAPPDDPRIRHLVLARATLGRLGAGAVASHVTAAALHGLPLWRIPLDRVHLTRVPRGSGGRSNRRVHVHAAPLDPQEVCLVAGTPVTSVARTIVDLARTRPFEEAVVVADAALRGTDDGADPDRSPARRGDAGGPVPVSGTAGDPRRANGAGPGPLDPGALTAALARAARWPGAPSARRALAFADGRSASVGESRSRVAISRAGLPAPVLQWPVADRDGRLIGYTDFGWPDRCLVGEFDGRVKYGRLLRPGQQPGDAVYQEKLREDRLRDQGLAVLRWTWTDLSDFAAVADRLRRRLARGPTART